MESDRDPLVWGEKIEPTIHNHSAKGSCVNSHCTGSLLEHINLEEVLVGIQKNTDQENQTREYIAICECPVCNRHYWYHVQTTTAIRYKNRKQKLILIRDDSHKKSIINKVGNILNGEKLDFLFIDGDHEYEGVKKDYNNYSKYVKKGGLIAFHDICLCYSEKKNRGRKVLE